MEEERTGLLKLPPEIIEQIIGFLSYEEVSRLRIVCRCFNRTCQYVLNKGFSKVDKYHAECLKKVKSQLPRRESERRTHQLARHCDILTAIETRLSLLGMTFMKYVDLNLCCFIPGKVIDEIYHVLQYVQIAKNPPRAHEILQELRDISSMAMEYFEEKIVPGLKQRLNGQNSAAFGSQQNLISRLPGPAANSAVPNRGFIMPRISPMRQDIIKSLQAQLKTCNMNMLAYRKEIVDLKSKLLKTKKKELDQEKKLVEQNRVISEHTIKTNQLERDMSEVNRKMNQMEQELAKMSRKMLSFDHRPVAADISAENIPTHSDERSVSTDGRILMLPQASKDLRNNVQDGMSLEEACSELSQSDHASVEITSVKSKSKQDMQVANREGDGVGRRLRRRRARQKRGAEVEAISVKRARLTSGSPPVAGESRE